MNFRVMQNSLKANFQTYSIDLLRLYLSICSEIDVVAKMLLDGQDHIAELKEATQLMREHDTCQGREPKSKDELLGHLILIGIAKILEHYRSQRSLAVAPGATPTNQNLKTVPFRAGRFWRKFRFVILFRRVLRADTFKNRSFWVGGAGVVRASGINDS